MPFDVEAVQIDGGSEFKAEFERECQERTIPLWVLPPRSPKPDGYVERTIGTWRCEFYGCRDIPDDLAEADRLVDAFADEFNRAGTRRFLGCLAPQEARKAAAPPPPSAKHGKDVGNPCPETEHPKQRPKDCPQAFHACPGRKNRTTKSP